MWEITEEDITGRKTQPTFPVSFLYIEISFKDILTQGSDLFMAFVVGFY